MQRARVSNHPCHRLSVPAAKRFWCRHCMMVFEDAITRWRHSRSCRSGGFDNFIRRREIETQALQKMAETLDPDMAMGAVPLPAGDSSAGSSKELCCFICRQRFMSLDEMREHVKYPCNKPANLQRPSMTVYIEEPTFGTGIQQHFVDSPDPHASTTSMHSETSSGSNPVTVFMNESDQPHAQGEAKPTNIYVNEKGETVIEVENLDLNTKSGELSLAHLLTQLSQQGIVFDQQASSEADGNFASAEAPIIQGNLQELELSQPTAVDAANTLTQLAGSAYRAASHQQGEEVYAFTPPPVKRIKSECIEVQYPTDQDSQAMEAVVHRDGLEVSEAENYIICTDESEVISVVRADGGEQEERPDGSSTVHQVFHTGSLVPACVVEEGATAQSASEQYTGQSSAIQQSFSGAGMPVKTEVMDAENTEPGGHQTVQYTVNTQSGENVFTSLAHLGQLEASAVQVEQEGLATDSEEHQSSQGSSSLEGELSNHPCGVQTVLIEQAGTSGSTGQLEGCADTEPFQTQTVSSSAVTSVQQSHGPGNRHNANTCRSLAAQKEEQEQTQRRVTRSVSLEIQNQKTRVLRNRSLPDCTVPWLKAAEIETLAKQEQQALPKHEQRPSSSKLLHSEVKSIQKQVQLVRQDKKRCSLERLALSSLTKSNHESKQTCQESCAGSDWGQKDDRCLGQSSITSLKTEDVFRSKSTFGQVTKTVQFSAFQTVPSKFEEAGKPKVEQEKRTCSKPAVKERPCKCIVCGLTFSSRQHLLRHKRVPCRIQHTRRMSQKVLRPRPAVAHKHLPKPKPQRKEQAKPRFPIAPLLAKRMWEDKGWRKFRPVHRMEKTVFKPVPNEPYISLHDKHLVVSCLSKQEQFLFWVGLVCTTHLSPAVLSRHQLVLRSKVNRCRQEQAAAQPNLPLTVDITSFSDYHSSPNSYPSPPVLERADLALMNSESWESYAFCQEPPLLEPVSLVPTEQVHDRMHGTLIPTGESPDKMIASAQMGKPLSPALLARHSTLTAQSIDDSVFDSSHKVQTARSIDSGVCGFGRDQHCSCCPYASQRSKSKYLFSVEGYQQGMTRDCGRSARVTRITIKSVACGLELAVGGEIIIKTAHHKDRVLLINPW